MSVISAFILGLLIGWLIELVIDFVFWRNSCRERERSLNIREASIDTRERQLGDADIKLKAREADIEHRIKGFETREGELRQLDSGLALRRTELDKQQVAIGENERSLAARVARLTSSETEAASKMSGIEQRATTLDAWEKRLAERDRQLSAKESEAVAAASSMAALVARNYLTKSGEDDLEVVEGIGPKINELLRAEGIVTFAQLAGTPVARLSKILEAAGPRFALAHPETWPEQADLLARRDFAGFEKLKQELIGGVRKAGPTQ
jgi:predicted flap endonuclease-1-like 5' DNA nuclease